MKRPTNEEIVERLKKSPSMDASVFIAGIDFALKYNEEKPYILKTFNIGYDVDVKVIDNLIQNHEDWDDFNPDKKIITSVLDEKDRLKIYYDLKSDYGVHENGLVITIDNMGRVWTDLGDTPWEGSGAHDEIEELIMGYVTKQKYK